MPVALITGASRGLGRALAMALRRRGWTLVVDARGRDALEQLRRDLSTLDGPRVQAGRAGPTVVAVSGDVADAAHRAELAATARRSGRLELLVNNASHLGPSPQPRLADYPMAELARVYAVDVFAPLALVQLVLADLLAAEGTVVDLSSDAAVEAYPGWGGYGSAKAALDQLTAVLAAEEPRLRAYAFDPGDMRTQLQQEAFPGQDISDRPEPESVVPALLRLLDERPPSGRYSASDLAAGAAVATDPVLVPERRR